MALNQGGATMEPTLDNVIGVLRSSTVPMGAIGIARELSKMGYIANRESVNKILYKGPFDKVEADSGAPQWKLRKMEMAMQLAGHFSFQIVGVGLFFLRTGVDEAVIESLLSPLMVIEPVATNVPAIVVATTAATATAAAADHQVTIRIDNSDEGKMVAKIAQKLKPGVEIGSLVPQ